MENYTTKSFEQDDNLILITGTLNVSYGYRVFELFQERTCNQLVLPKENGLKKFKQTADTGDITCSFERIPGYVPFKDFIGCISEKDVYFNVIQQSDFVYDFEFIGIKNELDEIFKKLKMAL
jgi:hypothetical protein